MRRWIATHPVVAFLVVFAVFPFLVPYKALATQVLPGATVPLDTSFAFYYFALALVVTAVAALKRILDSPFGAVLQAIRENSERASACGYDTSRVKLLSFVFSALFAGLAGSLD